MIAILQAACLFATLLCACLALLLWYGQLLPLDDTAWRNTQHQSLTQETQDARSARARGHADCSPEDEDRQSEVIPPEDLYTPLARQDKEWL